MQDICEATDKWVFLLFCMRICREVVSIFKEHEVQRQYESKHKYKYKYDFMQAHERADKTLKLKKEKKQNWKHSRIHF